MLWSEDWDIVAPGVSTLMGFPGWFLSHTKYSSSHGGSSIPVAPGTFPVVIYSHGWTGFRTNSVHQIESLVSNGFIVVAIDHTYGAVATRFPMTKSSTTTRPPFPIRAEVGEEAYTEAIEELVDVFSQDIVTVANSLEAGPNGPFGALAESADLPARRLRE